MNSCDKKIGWKSFSPMGLLDDFGGSVGGAQGADPLKAILMKNMFNQSKPFYLGLRLMIV